MRENWALTKAIFVGVVLLGTSLAVITSVFNSTERITTLVAFLTITVLIVLSLLLYRNIRSSFDASPGELQERKREYESLTFVHSNRDTLQVLDWFRLTDINRLHMSGYIARLGLSLLFGWATFTAFLGAFLLVVQLEYNLSSFLVSGQFAILSTGMLLAGVLIGAFVFFFVFTRVPLGDRLIEYIRSERLVWHDRIKIDALLSGASVSVGMYFVLYVPVTFTSQFPGVSEALSLATPYNLMYLLTFVILNTATYTTGLGLLTVGTAIIWPTLREDRESKGRETLEE